MSSSTEREMFDRLVALLMIRASQSRWKRGAAPIVWVRLPWKRRNAPGAQAWAVAFVFYGRPVILRGCDAALVDLCIDLEECISFEPDIFSDEETARIVKRTS